MVCIFICSCFVLPANDEDAKYPAMQELISQRKAHQNITEIWISLLPHHYQLRTFTIQHDGCYGLDYQCSRNENSKPVKIRSIGFANAQNRDVRLSPYQVMMAAKGKFPLAARQENADCIAFGDKISSAHSFVTYSYEAAPLLPTVGIHNNFSSVRVIWMYSDSLNFAPIV